MLRKQIPGLTLVLLLGVGVAEARAAAPRLLLLPIVVHSAEAPDYVRGGLADMLAARFERSGGVELIRVDDPALGTTKLDKALEEGRKLGADYVLFGSFTRFGKGASLDVQCAPVTDAASREPLREIFVHSGSIGEIIPDLDELAGKVSRFARGEEIGNVPPVASAGTAAAPGGRPPPTTAEIQDLVDRVESLEAAIAQLLESEGSDSIVETDEVR
jgi:hypothetical protein